MSTAPDTAFVVAPFFRVESIDDDGSSHSLVRGPGWAASQVLQSVGFKVVNAYQTGDRRGVSTLAGPEHTLEALPVVPASQDPLMQMVESYRFYESLGYLAPRVAQRRAILAREGPVYIWDTDDEYWLARVASHASSRAPHPVAWDVGMQARVEMIDAYGGNFDIVGLAESTIPRLALSGEATLQGMRDRIGCRLLVVSHDSRNTMTFVGPGWVHTFGATTDCPGLRHAVVARALAHEGEWGESECAQVLQSARDALPSGDVSWPAI